MNVQLDTGEYLNGDIVPRMTLRYDLTPIPSTLQCVIKADERVVTALSDGRIIIAGRDKDRYKIVKSEVAGDSGLVDDGKGGGKAEQVMEITAVLESCYPLVEKRQRAVIKERSTFGEIYRACGCTARAKNDIQVLRFTCLVGGTASYSIAQSMQEEATVPVWREGAFNFLRIREAMKQDPALSIDYDKTKEVRSGFLERHDIPGFLSVIDDGSFIFGNRETARVIQYTPRKDSITLRNMTTALVTRRTLDIGINTEVYAGDVISVAGVPHLAVTAVHSKTSGEDGENYYSQFWLATLA